MFYIRPILSILVPRGFRTAFLVAVETPAMAHLNRNALGLAPFVVFFILVLFAYHELWSGDHHLFYTFRKSENTV